MTTFSLKSAYDIRAYRLHQAVYETFEPPEAGRLLYRHAEGRLWVQTDWQPNVREERLPAGSFLMRIHHTPEVAALFRVGDSLRFSLRANPTWRDRDGKRRALDVTQGAKTAVVRAELASLGISEPSADQLRDLQLCSWLERRLAVAGEATAKVVSRELLRDQGREWLAVSYEGALIVDEPPALAQLLRSGIGSAKGFGFGLLQLWKDGK